MCYLVSSLPPAKDGNIRVPYISVYDGPPEGVVDASPETLARQEAEQLLADGHTEVRLWSLVAEPKMETIVRWNTTTRSETNG